ncbi:MAG: hypothetical protein ACTIA0_05465, partial [Citrobacter braakii]
RLNHSDDLMLSKTGFTHSDLLCWQIDYAGGSQNVNGTIMRDTYTYYPGYRGTKKPDGLHQDGETTPDRRSPQRVWQNLPG